MCNFSHLHVHTDVSPDGLGTLEKLVGYAAKCEYNALAMTDHGTLANAIAFWSTCNNYGIKPILGLEAYFLWKNKRHHITLNSMSQTGFNNLVKLSNEAHKNWLSGYPVLTTDIMAAADLSDIAMFTGCPASPIHEGELSNGIEFVGTMQDLFDDRLWVEMMCVVDKDFTSRPLKIAKMFDVPIMLTNDVHYTTANLAGAHRIISECRKNFSYDSNRLWLKTCSEMERSCAKLFDSTDVELWMNNAYNFAQLVVPWQMYSKPQLPESGDLGSLFFEKLSASFENDTVGRPAHEVFERKARLEVELETLKRMGFLDYFIILDDIVSFAITNDIVVGPGRGSAAGSYVLYLLGITGIDPIDHGLYFERFLNEARKEFPDVDMDFESDRRHEVLEYANERWGGVPIATYAHYGHKVIVADIGRALKLPRDLTERASENGPESDDFKEWAQLNKEILTAYNAMDGQIRHAGKHAGGIVITDQIIPIEHIGDQLVAAWIEGYNKELSKVGVVKYDMLGLTALSQLKVMRQIIKRDGVTVPPDDDPIFSIFQNGDVLGIFQWTGSDGIRDLTVRIEPSRFIDLVVINSMYRPGALDAGTADIYPTLRDAPRLIHPLVDPILAETRGVIVFQEQVMAIFAAIVGCTFAESDIIRRLIVKPRPEQPAWVAQLEEVKGRFFDNGMAQGVTKKVLEQLWAEIYTHTRYSFNKAHAAAYAAVACEMAWFKYHHPVVFYAVAMTYDDANIQAYLLEAASKDIKLLLPHINRPTASFEPLVSENAIQLPLGIVKHFSANGAKKVIDEFKKGPFESIEDFRKRMPKRDVTSRACRHLYTLDAFSGLPGDPSCLFNVEDDESITSGHEAQVEALGFVLPTKEMAQYIEQFYDNESEVVGFVKDWKDKVNKRGNRYRVYTMMPRGIWWTDDGFDKIKRGDFLRIVKNGWGKATSKKRLKIVGGEK